MVGIRLGDKLEGQLSSFAASFDRPKSSLIREAIEAKLEEWEDLRMILESSRNPGRRWTLDEMIEQHASESRALED